MGATGGGLGYGASSAGGSGGIPNSIAIKFGIFNSNSTALLTNGAFPGTSSIDMTPSGINLHTGDIFYVHVTYDGVILNWTVIDSVTGAVFSASKAIDIPTVIGGPAAFVGFTGGSGGLTAIQDILAWTFQTSGTISAYATLTPASLPFGNQSVGTSSASQVATLTNNGPGTVNISGISVSGDFAQTNNCGSSLAPGLSCVINISFAPTVSGPRAGTLTVSDDAAIAPQTVALSGLGVVNGGTLAVNFSGGFTSTGLRLNGAAINGTRLRITDGGTGQARSAYFSTPVDVHAFVNDFTFQLTNATADGFTFTVQNSAVTAVGGSGGGLGYGPSNPGGTTGGIAKSVAVKFDLFNSAGEGNNSTGLFTNGAFPGIPASDLTPSGVNLHSGDIFTVHMTYDGGTLAWTVTDTNTGSSFSTSAPVNIPAVVGAPTAFIGFTGGTGGLTAIQDILSRTFQTDATAPLATASPASLTFTGQTVGTPSASQQITLTNNGPGSLTISSITANGDFSQTNNCDTTVAATCTINITFTPAATGARLGTLTVNDSAFITPQTVALSGMGVQDATTLALVSSLPNSIFGQPVTFTATITPATPTAAPAPTGSITFAEGAATLATVAVSSNSASFTTSALTAGSHNITAAYSGDALYSASTSPVLLQTVNQAAPVITWNTPAPITYGTVLDATQLNATANISGTFVYTPAAGTVLTAGTQTLSLTFTPADTLNYTSAAATVLLTVNPAPLTVTANNKTRSYAQANPILDGVLIGIQNGDNITAVYTTTATPASPVGDYPIVPALEDPDGKLANYAVTINNGTLTVTAATLTVTANDATRQYGLANPAFTGTITGVQNGDNITATYSSNADTTSPVGTYSIVPTLVDPDGKLVNYTVVKNNGALTVTPAPLTASANNKSRLYGQANPPFDGTLIGVLNNDSITLSFTTSATQASPVGSYLIVPGLLDPTSKLGNYAVTVNNGLLTITPAPLAVTANNKTKTYGQPNPALDGVIIGIQNGDNITAVFTTTAVQTSPVGSYPIMPALLDPTGKLGNYSVTINNGSLAVTPTPLVITADNETKIFNTPNPPFTVTYSGFVLGEGPAVLGGTLSCTTTAGTNSPVGSYPITCSGQSSSNYTVSYLPGVLSIIFAPAGMCDGEPGHTILPPIAANGSSVFNSHRSVPARFRVCDANGISIGAPGTVQSFNIIEIITGTGSQIVNLPVPSRPPDSAFRFERGEREWEFHIDVSRLSPGSTYVFRIRLNDGSNINFRFGVRKRSHHGRDDGDDDDGDSER